MTRARGELRESLRRLLEESERAVTEATEALEVAKLAFRHITYGAEAARCPCPAVERPMSDRASRAACRVNALLTLVFDEESIAERCARNAGLEAERLANAQHCLAVADAIADSEARWYDAHAEVEP